MNIALRTISGLFVLYLIGWGIDALFRACQAIAIGIAAWASAPRLWAFASAFVAAFVRAIR